jgi:hypothetical protein
MHIAGVSTKPLMGKASIGYDCNSKLLCVAAYLLADDACSVEVSDDDSWVEFTDGSPTEKLHRTSRGANFQYVKYSGGTTGNPIGKLSKCMNVIILLLTRDDWLTAYASLVFRLWIVLGYVNTGHLHEQYEDPN